MIERIRLRGAPGSPYTRKMVALLRYRRIPYALLHGAAAEAAGLPKPRVALLPTFYLQAANGTLEAVIDSTPIIRRLEAEVSGRSVIPADPALAFIDALIEDYADEWLTKAMYHYRWAHPADIARAGQLLPRWYHPAITRGDAEAAAAAVTQRQTSRLHVVGSNATTAPVIEGSYRRLLELLDAHIPAGPFVLGRRPAACDFALFGQLTQLVCIDPTPAELAWRLAPSVGAWVQTVEDLSGLEPGDSDWFDIERLPETVRALLAEIGRVYVPVMLANAAAITSGASEVRAVVDGAPWTQAPFPYQAKCVEQIRAHYAGLTAADRERVDRVLAGSGCEALAG